MSKGNKTLQQLIEQHKTASNVARINQRELHEVLLAVQDEFKSSHEVNCDKSIDKDLECVSHQ